MSLESKDPLENKEETDPNKRDLEPMIVEESQNVATVRNENLPPVADDLSPSKTGSGTDSVSSKLLDQDNCEPATEPVLTKPPVIESETDAETVSSKSLKQDPNKAAEETTAQESESEDIFDFVDPTGDSDSTIDNYDAYYEAAENFYDSDSGEEIKALMNLQDIDNMGNTKSKSTNDTKANGKKDKRYQDSSSDEYEESWPKPWRSTRERVFIIHLCFIPFVGLCITGLYRSLFQPYGEKTRKPYSFTRRWSQKDTEDYRQGYPGKKDYSNHKLNLDFYTNKTASRPSGIRNGVSAKLKEDHPQIVVIHCLAHRLELAFRDAIKLSGNKYYDKTITLLLDFGVKAVDTVKANMSLPLERVGVCLSELQTEWTLLKSLTYSRLFPIRENGMNFHAQELQLHEAKSIIDNRMAHKRVLKSYKLMLDFYGMHLKDEKTGELERGENWRERFAHLNRSMHNYLRITRILKSLGELGYEHLKAPFVRFILEEALEKRTLERTVDSCYNYWIETIKDDKDREELHDYADELITGGSSS